MASIRKRGSNSYLIVVSRGYDYEGNRLKSVQKTVKPPKEYTPKQAEKWVKEQAILFEREVQHAPEPINRSITLEKYVEHGSHHGIGRTYDCAVQPHDESFYPQRRL